MEHHINIWSDIIFPLINFFGFAGIIIYFLRKPIKELFSARSDAYRKEIAAATDTLRDAQYSIQTSNEKLQKIEQEKEMLLKNTKKELETLKERSAEELQTLIEKIKSENNQKLEEEIKKAQRELKSVASKKIIDATEKLLKKNLGTKDHQGLADDFLDSSFNETKIRTISNESTQRRTLRESTH